MVFPLGAIPYVVGAALLAVTVGAAYFKGHSNGAESRNPEIVALQSSIERSRLAAAAAEEKAQEAARNVRVEYRDRVKEIVKESEAEKEIVEVVRREADPNCTLPASYRELWDRPIDASGAEGKSPGGANGARVTVAEAAEAARLARQAFKQNLNKLEKWQKLAKDNGWEIEPEAKADAVKNYLAQIPDAPPSPNSRP